MVMSKVSKTVIASFLCLLFNAGGNVTNAMDNKDLIINNKENLIINNNNNDSESNMKEYENYINNNISNNMFSNNLFSSNFKLETNETKTEDNIKNEDKKDDDDKKTPDGEKSVWRWLFPVMTGVGGTAIGIVVGKFVL